MNDAVSRLQSTCGEADRAKTVHQHVAQLSTVKWPSWIATPAGVCIQLFAKEIHEARKKRADSLPYKVRKRMELWTDADEGRKA